ncbi:MAG TPA: NTP transferase domain-containing protein, partial [Dermatophilaceae bacterium]|nr:NTP transferase domain-containing protein [Dermatophilaceae bacterium]
MSVGVVIVAAGSGSRLGASVPKAFVLVGGHPLLEYAVRAALSACPAAVVVAAP